MTRVLIIDDDILFCEALGSTLEEKGYTVMVAHTLERGRTLLKKQPVDIAFIDVFLPDGNGLDLLAGLSLLPDSPHAIVVTAQGDAAGAESAIASGAWDYVQKPAHIGEIMLMVERVIEVRERRRDMPDFVSVSGIVAASNPMRQAMLQIFDAAQSEAPALISGETGTGKELMARVMHKNSRRSDGPFVVVDCGALTPSLMESELFGSVRGAFTGAVHNRPGLVMLANGGTLFLDEVGELAFEQQKVFLRLLQERSFRPVGAGEEMQSDFKIVAATNRSLNEMVAGGMFRQDLLFRLQGIHIELPPLRARGEDILLIAKYSLARVLLQYGLGEKNFSADAKEALATYAWPGNVRELIHAVESAVLAATDGHLILLQHLPIQLRTHAARLRIEEMARPGGRPPGNVGFEAVFGTAGALSGQPASADLQDAPFTPITWKEFHDGELFGRKREYLLRLLRHTDGNVPEAARVAGVSRQRLYTLLKEHGIARNWQA